MVVAMSPRNKTKGGGCFRSMISRLRKIFVVPIRAKHFPAKFKFFATSEDRALMHPPSKKDEDRYHQRTKVGR